MTDINAKAKEKKHGKSLEERRTSRRFRTIFSGQVRHLDDTQKCVIYDVSTSGAKINTDLQLPLHTEIDVYIDRLGPFRGARAKVIWHRGGKVGIEFIGNRQQLENTISELLPNRWTLTNADDQ